MPGLQLLRENQQGREELPSHFTVTTVQVNIYESYIYRKDLSWLHFDEEPRIQERQQVKDQQSYISVFVTLTFHNSS